MRLPVGNQNLGVQSLGRESGETAARGKIEMANAITGQIDAYQERKTRHQTALADARIATAEADVRRKYDGLDHIEVADLPKSLQKEYASETRVPAFEVRARLYEEEMGAALNDAAELIGNKNARSEWQLGKRSVISSKVAERYIERDQQQIDFYKKEAVAAAKEAVDDGHYEVARHLIQESELDSVEREEALKNIGIAQEQSLVDDTLRTGTIEDVQELHQVYASKKYDGEFDSNQALQAKQKLKTRLEFLKNERDKREIGEKAEGFVNKALADEEMSATEQLAIIDGIKDDEVRQEARRRYQARKAAIKAAELEEKTNKQNSYLESYRENPTDDFSGAPDLASEQEARRHLNLVTTGQKKETDLKLYQKLRQDILDGKKVNLELHMSQFTDTDYKELVRLTQADSDQMKSAQSLDGEIKSVMTEMGVSVQSTAKASEEQTRIYYLINSELQYEAAAKGGELNFEERQKVYDRIQLRYVKESSWWFPSEEGIEDVVQDIPLPELRAIQAGLRARSVPVTAETIRSVYDAK